MDSFLDRISQLSPKKLALLAAELQQRVTELEQAAHEPVAIIGLACRMPGGANTPDEFWTLLRDGRDAIQDISKERCDLAGFTQGALPDGPAKFAGFLENIDRFDASFFGIAPREAVSMDPQQRLLLEIAWEALENSGIPADELRGSETGVFAGISGMDYAMLLNSSGQMDTYSATGAANSIAAGRIAYFFGLQGPAMSLDTSCSSAATAIHVACGSLRSHECRMALAAGVSLAILPQITESLCKLHMLAEDGRCKTFSAEADGFVRGEGCGVIVLKRLRDAIADGNNVLAVIRGTAINQDGRSSGLTAPNGPAQEAVIRAALKNADLSPADIDYLEAHGTGTALGDPIEAGALAGVFAAGRPADHPLTIGSVKTNIGHLEAAAGMAGVIKTVLALQHQRVPGHLHAQNKNPRIPWNELPFQIPSSSVAWPSGSRVRRAGVSSFGFSGTNAHIVLEEAPRVTSPPVAKSSPRPVHIVTASAKSPEALKHLAKRHAHFLSAHPEISIEDFCFATNAGRSHFPHRLAALTSSTEEARDAFAAYAAGDPNGGARYRFVSDYRTPEIAFLFTGQGSQYAGMGRSLFESAAVFREALTRCDQILRSRRDESLLDVILGRGDSELLNQTEWTQPALFAFEFALSELWRSWGIAPSVVMGHSLGEYVAACVAGIFTLEDGLTLAYERGRLMGRLATDGAMSAIQARETEVAAVVTPFSRTVSIAAINGPEDVVISGLAEHVAAIEAHFSRRGVLVTRLNVSHPFHSPSMEPMLAEFEKLASEIHYSNPSIDFISNVTGELLLEAPDAAYWCRHARQTVQFLKSCECLEKQGCRAFVEIGPAPVLVGMAKRALPRTSAEMLPSLRKNIGDWRQLSESLLRLYLAGAPVSWKGFNSNERQSGLIIPNYPFQRQRFWIDLPTGHTAARTLDPDQLIYKLEWRPASQAHRASAPPSQLMTGVDAAMQRVAGSYDVESMRQFLADANKLALDFVLNTLNELRPGIQRGFRIPAATLCESLRVLPAHRRLLNRMFSILQEEGYARIDVAECIFLRPLARVDALQRLAEMRAQYPRNAPELDLAERATHLVHVLRGDANPLEILFPNGSPALAEGIYEKSLSAQIFNSVTAEAARSAVDSLPSGRNIRILELGAGTGSTTAAVLPLLPADRVDYLVTDVSQVFLTRAKDKFAAYPFVRYALHDVDSPNPPTGSAVNSFDIVIAANVLHATDSVRKTIANVKRLIAPGGYLVLLEGTRTERLGDITLGTIEGWWKFKDTDVRSSSVLLPRAKWLELLEEAGFSASALSEDPDYGGMASRQTVIIARAPDAENDKKDEQQCLVLVSGTTGSSDALAAALRHRGVRVIQALTQDSGQVLQRVSALTGSVGLVYLGGTEGAQEDDFPKTARRLSSELLQLTQAALALPRPPQLWVITRGAQPAGPGELNVPASALWGFARVAASEHPELKCRCVDIDTSTPADFLADVLISGSNEPALAIRDGKLLVLRLIQEGRSDLSSSKRLSPEASYLVTGAYGVLGRIVSKWLAENGARALILAGRHNPSPDVAAEIEHLRRMGIRVVTICADVSKEDDVRHIFAQIEVLKTPLRGILHLAGKLNDASVLQQTPDRFADVMGPKVDGSWLLHQHSLKYALDLFVMFSSASSVLGTAGQANYAAANAFMDALACHRQALGLPGTSIDWGAWADSGAAMKRDVLDDVAAHGVDKISAQQGLKTMVRILHSAAAQAVVFPIASAAFQHSSTVQSAPLFELARFPGSCSREEPMAKHEPKDDIYARLRAAVPEQQRAILKAFVTRRVIKVLGLDGNFTLRGNQPLSELGIDSLMVLELRNDLQRALGTTLPSTVFFEYPTLDEIVNYSLAVITAKRPQALPASRPDYEQITI